MNVLILGRAKTGTTIIAKTIQHSMRNTLFLMEPKSLDKFMLNFKGNLVTKIIYEHWDDKPHSRMAIWRNELPVTFNKRILIVRDPRDELISRMFYVPFSHVKDGLVNKKQLKPWLSLVKKKEIMPNSVSFLELIESLNYILNIHINFKLDQTFKYLIFAKNHMTKRPFHVLRYEDFITNKLESLENYLGFTLSEDRTAGRFNKRIKRTASYNNWKSFFLASDLEVFKKMHHDDMSSIGYLDWDLETDIEINPEHGSIYLERLIDEAQTRFRSSLVNRGK